MNLFYIVSTFGGSLNDGEWPLWINMLSVLVYLIVLIVVSVAFFYMTRRSLADLKFLMRKGAKSSKQKLMSKYFIITPVAAIAGSFYINFVHTSHDGGATLYFILYAIGLTIVVWWLLGFFVDVKK